jgi:hypothetical protein
MGDRYRGAPWAAAATMDFESVVCPRNSMACRGLYADMRNKPQNAWSEFGFNDVV